MEISEVFQIKYAKREAELPPNSFVVMICLQSTKHHAFSSSGGWYVNEEDDLYLVFDDKESAMNWIERKLECTYAVEIRLYDYQYNYINKFSPEFGKEDYLEKEKKPFWKFWS